jgi:hypothetical protein
MKISRTYAYCGALFAAVSIGCGPRPIVEEKAVIEDRTTDPPAVDVDVSGNGVKVERQADPGDNDGVDVQVGGGRGVQVKVEGENQ